MFCKQCCRIFIPFFLWVLLPVAAGAYPAFRDDPEKVARMHCQLLLHAISTKAPLTMDLLDTMMDEPGFSMEAGISSDEELQQVTGDMPDFGFLIGDRWMFADRPTRSRFNQLMAELLKKREHLGEYLGGADYSAACLMEVHVIQADPKEESLPSEQRTYLAEATTRLPRADGKAFAPLTYALRKEPGRTWEITDIRFAEAGMLATYGMTYSQTVIAQGFGPLLESMEKELGATRDSGDDRGSATQKSQ